MGKYDPPRKEYWFRLVAGIVVMILVAIGLSYRGFVGSPGSLEAVLTGAAFGLGTIGWSAWKLWKSR